MSKVKVVEGKLCRDYSTPLFFPSHWLNNHLILFGEWIMNVHDLTKKKKEYEYITLIKWQTFGALITVERWMKYDECLCYWSILEVKEQSPQPTNVTLKIQD
jgi:hypothetical protein